MKNNLSLIIFTGPNIDSPEIVTVNEIKLQSGTQNEFSQPGRLNEINKYEKLIV